MYDPPYEYFLHLCRLCKSPLSDEEVICIHCQYSIVLLKARNDKKKAEAKKNEFTIPTRVIRLED